MNTMHEKYVFTALAAVMLWAAALPVAIAQETSHAAVVYPMVYSRNSGSETSRQTGVRSMREVLEKAGYTLVSNTVAANTWRKLGLASPSTDEVKDELSKPDRP